MQIGYCRVSTIDQNPNLQRDTLSNAGCERLFEDRMTGTKKDRPGLTEALAFARPGDTITVWRLDRLGRSLKDLLEIVADLEGRGVGLRSLTESIDTSSSGGRLIFSIFGAIGEFERNLIRERTLAGLDAARRRGRTGGRPKALSERDVLAAKAILNEDNLTVAEVAGRLGVSVPTLYRHVPGGRAALTISLAD
ncbi:recombinase family protein [Nisaea sp.]|uniref:recombinase family protein n=1 Tax=Nisaea sp. TaxID=2024842 RepID=UPI0032638AB6